MVKGGVHVQRAKNGTLKLQLRKKIPFICFLFEVNRSFRSEVMIENIASRVEISDNISYVFYCFLKLRYLTFSTKKIHISKSN